MGGGIVGYGWSNKNVSRTSVGVKTGVFTVHKNTHFLPTESEGG
jgi:hypothetical protein